MRDMAGIFDQLQFLDVQLYAVHGGLADELTVGFRSLFGQLFLKDLKDKIRRGQSGRARSGMNTGGLSYGYKLVPGRAGEREIIDEEAEVVRRIFREFAMGANARMIAKKLNDAGIKPPRGRSWCANTINGGPGRGRGILRNETYAGRLVWNRVRYITDPKTGKRTVRNNDSGDLVTAEVPHLAIVPPELWAAVQARLEEISKEPPAAHRKKRHLLSGLLRCGSCGSGMSTAGKDKSGRIRIRCSRHRESGDCPDAKTFYLDVIEEAVLAALKRELSSPQAIEEFVRAYCEERDRLNATAYQRHRQIDQRLVELSRELDRVTDYLIRGIGDETRLDVRAKELKAEERNLHREAAALPNKPSNVTIHPELLKRYHAEIERLERGLADRLAAAESPAAIAIREMIETVTIRRNPSTGRPAIKIVGSLNVLTKDGEQAMNKVCASMVPQEGSTQSAHHDGPRFVIEVAA